ncbi:MAG TPA: hypothetical protein VGC11_03545 [Acidimicrobiia bacterium]
MKKLYATLAAASLAAGVFGLGAAPSYACDTPGSSYNPGSPIDLENPATEGAIYADGDPSGGYIGVVGDGDAPAPGDDDERDYLEASGGPEGGTISGQHSEGVDGVLVLSEDPSICVGTPEGDIP